ncbi:hypothetical protein [Streptomyces sp. NRRL S-15]|uniref:hypothetical protein n=1 Tax=Streptomyces sp. NRRL S-15 TaxID=1463886 RepID=UPI001F48B3D4|nr:hypothetical protein [Streptomyces sp. NRRL S-15]
MADGPNGSSALTSTKPSECSRPECCNWDENKGVTIDLVGDSAMSIPDGQMARFHTTGIAREFDMAGSSSVKHYDPDVSAPNQGPMPQPDGPERDGDRTDPGREQQEGR